MERLTTALERAIRRLLATVDTGMNRVYGWRGNPLYQSGAIASALLALLIVTGVYLLLFYRVATPYQSVARISGQVWAGSWIRGLHRYASDAALFAAAVHALRMYAQRRRWGPRALAWISGLFLVGLVLICGWTGYVMVWDEFGRLLAVEGARILDLLPIFSEPIGRAFVGERLLPGAFFFLNLFLHIALPIGLGIVLWVHVSKVARPVLFPPRRLAAAMLAVLLALSLVWPAPLPPEASAFRWPVAAPLDLFYAFWLPVTKRLPPGVIWLAGGAAMLALVLVPVWSRPRPDWRPPPSLVDERLCTGCRQCALDCPYEAIAMRPRGDDGRAEVVAHVDPGLCVSCGICAGSCAPMGVGPPGRTGRDQLDAVKAFITRARPAGDDVVIVACTRGAGGLGEPPAGDGRLTYPVECAGNLHTSVVEYLIRAGAGGVLVLACPGRDCWNREGPVWLEERMYRGREAELQDRLDRRRVRLAHVAVGDRTAALAEVAAFQARVKALEEAYPEAEIAIDALCEPAAEEGAGA